MTVKDNLHRGKRLEGCCHPTTLGVTLIEGREIGLCPDCRIVVSLKDGRPVNKDVALMWIALHGQEADNFGLKDVYKRRGSIEMPLDKVRRKPYNTLND